MRNLTHDQSPDINLAFNPGSPRAFSEIGRLVGSCNLALREAGVDPQLASTLLPGITDAESVVRQLPNLSATLVDYGDHPGVQGRNPLRTEADRDIIHAVVNSAATGKLPVEREVVKDMVERWYGEMHDNNHGLKAARDVARIRLRQRRMGRWVFERETARAA